MAWRKLEDTFYDSPKLNRLARHLAVNKAQAAGHLALLWSWALRHAPDGDLSKYDIEDIEDAVSWSGERGAFLQACATAKLVDVIPNDQNVNQGSECNTVPNDKYVIHNWMSRGGSYAESQRKQLSRKRNQPCNNLSGTVRDNPGQSGNVRSRIEEKRIKHTCGVEPIAQTTNDPKSNKAPSVNGDVDRVWQHYRIHHPRSPKVLKSSRKEYRLIKQRLEDFDAATLQRAIDGYHRSPFHTGANDRGRRYLSLDLMLRDISHVQAGLDFAEPVTGGNGSKRLLDTTLSNGNKTP